MEFLNLIILQNMLENLPVLIEVLLKNSKKKLKFYSLHSIYYLFFDINFVKKFKVNLIYKIKYPFFSFLLLPE